MKRKAILTLVFLVAIILIAAPTGASPTLDKGLELQPNGNVSRVPAPVLQPKGAAGPEYYIIQLKDAPLASYRGGIDGLEATNPGARGERKVNVDSAASQAYLDYLGGKQAELVAHIEATVGRSVEVHDSYQYAFNGIAVWLSPEEAAAVATLEGVRQLQRNLLRYPTTDAGPEWIGAAGIWDGSATGGLPGTMGEGVVAAIIDTGINMDSASFADVGGDGYDHTNPFGAGVYRGWCDPGNPNYDPTLVCNDKLVGVWSFPNSGMDPEDPDGHGSHTSSTVAGNVVTATMVTSTTVVVANISGVAPHANVLHYDACGDVGCNLTDLVAAIDQTIPDGADTINYSIGGGASNPWADSDALAFLSARDAGIFVATSAGNSGPGASTIGSPADAPWLTASAAGTHNRAFLNSLVDMSGGSTTPPADIEGRSITAGYGPETIVYAGDFGDPLCPPGGFAGGTWSGEIVVCDRGIYARVDKGQAVLDGGGGGMILVDNIAGAVIGGMLADPHFLPAVHIPLAEGDILKTWLGSGTGHTGTITGTTLDLADAHADTVSAFSSRGPNPSVGDVIKPDVIAPGVDILAAYKDGEEYWVISGTSMSSPHTSGAGALLTALHPTWTPAEIQSALMSTGVVDGVLKEDDATQADPFDIGAGRVDLSVAGQTALVLDETYANYLAADPGAGGDPKDLNHAAAADDGCVQICSWARTLTSVAATDTSWTASGSSLDGLVITVEPSDFTVSAGGTQVITITADATGLPDGDWVFGEVTIAPVPTGAPEAPMVELYDNGPLITHPGGGAGSADASALQTALSMNVYGFGNSLAGGTRIADEFTVTDAEGWTIDTVTLWAYQSFVGPPSTINHVNLQIWDGAPNAGGSVIWGDTTTNRLASTVWDTLYRVLDTSLTNTDRPVMANTVTVGTTLGPGTYWLDWQTGGTATSGPWAPPITILGNTTTGNGLQQVGGVWAAVLDSGTSTPQGFPFTIEGSVGGGGGGETPEVHMPVAVVPQAGDLPDSMEIETRRDAGSQVLADLTAIEITDLTIDSHGLAEGTITQEALSQDPTNGDPYNNLNDGTTFWITVPVPAGALRLIAETVASTAVDMDLYVGQDLDGDGPELSEELCGSFTPTIIEYCEIENPAAGDYWVLVQNWLEGPTPPDDVTLVTAVVESADAGNLTVEGPASVPAGTPFDLTVFWDEPLMEAGDYWYGTFDIGSDAGNPGNIGSIDVRIQRQADDVTKSVSSSNAVISDTLTYTITVQPNITPVDLLYTITDTIPAGLTYVEGSATANFGTVSVAGGVLTWSGTMATPGAAYSVITSNEDPVCAAPLAAFDDDPADAYVNLEFFGFLADPGISGDTIWFSEDYPGGPIEFFGEDQGVTVNFTDDGFTFFDPSTPGSSPWINQAIPDPTEPNNLQAILWNDWEVVYDAGLNRGVTLAYLTSDGTTPVAQIVEYDDIEPWPAGGSNTRYDYQVIMYEDVTDAPGAYEYIFAYDNIVEPVATGTIGLENVDGTLATEYTGGISSLSDGMAICFDWVGVETEAAVITYQATVNSEPCEPVTTNNVEHQTDNPGSMVATTSVDVSVACPAVPAISLDKTVAVDEADCGTTDFLTIQQDTEIVYCYEVTNTGTVTFTTHSLVDDQLGDLLTDMLLDLGPGASYLHTETVTMTTIGVITNTGTWTATDGVNTATATDTATVDVTTPTDVPAISLDKTVAVDEADCGTTDSLTVQQDTEIVYCYEVTNTGTVTFTTHSLVDDQLGDLLTDMLLDLGPGASYLHTETVTMTTIGVITNTGTWTATDGVNTATATDTATVDVTTPTGVSLTAFEGTQTPAALLPTVLAVLTLALLAGAYVLRRRRA